MPDVTVPIIQTILHPPLGVMGLEHLPTAPFTGGSYAIDRPRGPLRVDAYGLFWSVSAAALGTGNIPGLVTEWEDRVVEIGVIHQMLDGTFVYSQRLATNLDAGFVLWEEALPYGIDLVVGPPFLVDFYWCVIG